MVVHDAKKQGTPQMGYENEMFRSRNHYKELE